MTKAFKIVVLPGDGIGPEVVAEGVKVLRSVDQRFGHRFDHRLLTHFVFPAEHWGHLRTTNPIESTFATVKLRQRATRGAGSRTAGLTMAFKLLAAPTLSVRHGSESGFSA